MASRFLDEAHCAASAFAVDLLLREFINNAIIHGNRKDPRAQVQVTISIKRGRVRIRIADEGEGFDWKAARWTPPEPTATAGRGLPIGAEWAERISYNRKGNVVSIWVKTGAERSGHGHFRTEA